MSTPPVGRRHGAESNVRISLIAGRGGFALESTLILLVLLTVLIGAAVATTVIVQRTAGMDYRGSRVAYAAEAGADNVMAQLAAFVQDGVITEAERNSLTTPVLSGFTFNPPLAAPVGAAVPRTLTEGPYAGLYGLNQQFDIRITARDATQNQSAVIVSVNAQSIPLFQFGVFFAEDLEIHNGPRMDFAGRVHTNGNLYLTSNATYFQDVVTTPDSVFWRRKPTAERLAGVYINNASGVAQRLDFDSRDAPGSAFVSRSNSRFDGRLMSGASGVTALNLPLPAGVPPRTMVEERVAGDDDAIRGVKFSWKADMHIVVDLQRIGSGAGVFCDPTAGGALTIDLGGRPAPDPVTCGAIFQGKPNRFHDGREHIGVDLLDIDVDRLEQWIEGVGAADPIDLVYITFTNADATFARDYPAVRLKNGSRLRFPLTVATDRPMYVWDNYNTVGWRPAAMVADAITFLSSSWNEGNGTTPYTGVEWDPAWDPNAGGAPRPYPNPSTGGPPPAAPMTVYAAIAAGHSASPCDVNRVAPACDPNAFAPPPLTPTISVPNYGGGLENFPRFLENWSNLNMTYRGSLVSLFQSRYAKRYRWSWRDYYRPPARDWQFDTRFRDPTQLPPGTPVVGSVIQTAFRPVY